MQAATLLNASNQKVLAQLPSQYQVFFKWFLAITQVHRPSFHLTEKAIPTVKEWASKLGFQCQEDEGHNMIFSCPASPGKENFPSIVIQGHLDIVAVGNFNADGSVPVKIEDGKLTSGVSTLGGDDGVAIATIFALMETHKDFEHGPLEFLITTDEEVGLLGATKLAGPPFMKSRTMINLDSEEWGIFYTSCAGGLNIFYEKELQRTNATGHHVKIHVHDFLSGHTGILIQENRQNADKWLARILIAAREHGFDFVLSNIQGGEMHNAIPHDAVAEVVIKDAVADFTAFVKQYHNGLVEENKLIETNIPKIEVSTEGDLQPFSKEDTNTLLNLIEAIPHGVFCMSPAIEGMVNTSQSLSVLKIENNKVLIQVFARTNENNHIDFLINKNKAIAALANYSIRIPEEEIIRPWPPALGSKIMDVAKNVFKTKYNVAPVITGIHAGLECGAIQNRGYNDLEAISFGPIIKNAHTVNEYMTIDTAEKCYDLTLSILKEWCH